MICSPWPIFVDYVKDTWIISHKEKFVTAWTNKVMHLRNTTTSSYEIVDLFQLTLINCWNFNCVDFDRLIHIGDREEHEPYIEASQAQMVYYVDDVVNEGWSVVVHIKPRDLYDMGEEVEENAYENEPYQEQQLEQFSRLDDQYVQLATNHLNDDIVD